MKLNNLPAIIGALALLAGCASTPDAPVADQIILGHIITMNPDQPEAQAMTVTDGTIQYVGSKAAAMKLRGENTEVRDYGKNSVYPGFLESHAHGAGAGLRLAGQANLADGESLEDYIKVMKEWIAAHPDKEVYQGSGWKTWIVENPTAEMLEALGTDKPVMLSSIDGHSMWVNYALMKQQKIDAAYAKKMGAAQVRVDEKGNPTGLLTESAATSLISTVKVSVDEFKEYILAWQDFFTAKGYTATSEAGVEIAGAAAKAAYSELGKSGELKLRTYAYHLVKDDSVTPVEDVQAALEDIEKYNNEYFKVIGMKIFIDGVVEAHTAWLNQDYLDVPGYHGLERYANHDVAVTLLKESSRNGLSVHAHTIGDGAVKFMLDAIEEALKETGDYDQRNILVHLQLVAPEDFKRFAEYKVIAGTAPLWVPKVASVFEQECASVGAEKAERAYPVNSFVKEGVVNVSHTDYPVSTALSIPHTFTYGVLRSEIGDDSTLRGPEEAVSRMDILKSLTTNVAYLWKEEARLGSIEVGKIANATVFDKDFLKDPIEEVHNSNLVATIIDGSVVYSGK